MHIVQIKLTEKAAKFQAINEAENYKAYEYKIGIMRHVYSSLKITTGLQLEFVCHVLTNPSFGQTLKEKHAMSTGRTHKSCQLGCK